MSMVAAFVSPGLATAGVLAVAAPILIHLFARRRFRRIRWAAMDFLIDAERRNRRRVRLEELILLALRCLAVLLVGLMVARPFLSAGELASAFGGAQRVERLLVLDDSFSMGFESAEGTPFGRAKEAAARLIEIFRRDNPDDAVTIVRTSSPGSPIVAGAYLESEQVEAMLARLEPLTATQHAMEIDEVFRGLAEVLSRDADAVNAAVYFISDFQRRDWGGPGGAGVAGPRELGDGTRGVGPPPQGVGHPAVAAPLAKWAQNNRGLRLVLVNVGEENAPNLAIVGLKLTAGQAVAGTTAAMRVAVANFARQAVANIQLHVESGLRGQPAKTLPALGEFQEASIDVEAEFLRPGDESIRAEMPRDALPLDNVRYAAVEVVGALRVLLVNGEPAADEYDDEVALLRTALRPEGEVFSGHEVVVVDEADLETANLAGLHVLILANVYRLSQPAIESVERFVRGGGGLMIFLGDQVDASAYNADLFRDGEGLLPAALGEIVRPPAAARLVIVDRLHPALRALGGDNDPLGIGQIPFFEYFSVRPPDGADELDDGTQESGAPPEPGGVTPRGAEVLARFADTDESPAVIERAAGAGRVLLVTTSADKEWNAWADHPTYLPVMTELLRHAAGGRGREIETWVGSAIEMSLDPAVFETDVIVRPPSFPNDPEATVTAAADGEGVGLRIRWEHTESAGIYQFLLRRRDGGESVRLAAVNVDPTESDLTLAPEDAFSRSLAGVPYEVVRGLEQLAEAAGEERTELWTPLLLGAMAVLMMEQFLAWRWGRTR